MYYVFATGYRGLGVKSMRQAVKHHWIQSANIFDNYEDAEKWYNHFIEKKVDKCYIFDGKNIVKEY